MVGSAITPLLPAWDTLSLAEQIAQMVVVRASGYLFDHQIRYPVWEPPAATLQHWVQTLGVGGVIWLGGSAAELALRTQQFQEWARVPLLMAADVEEGVGQRFPGATWFPPPMALGAMAHQNLHQAQQAATQMGAAIAQESLAVGLNWVLAPVVDVNHNPANPVINVRAFGETPTIVSQLATAFIRGTQQHPVLATAKHFPGHGDTAVDSHLDLPVIPHAPERLAAVELPPFQAAIAAGVDAVMSAHLLISAWDPNLPATLSPRILTQELRHNLGFEGLIVTDALVMGAIANRYGANEAAVLAVEAGADILLMPLDPAGAIQAVCAAVEAGRITPERIQASVERIWRAKFKVCALPTDTPVSAHAWETLSPPPIRAQGLVADLAQPATVALTTEILQASQKLHLPAISRLTQARWLQQPRNLIVVDSSLECDFLGMHTPAIALPRQLGYSLQLVDQYTPASPQDPQSWQPTLLQLFIRGNPFRGGAGLTQAAQHWLQRLLDTMELQALAIYGSPYILAQFSPDLPPEIPYVFSYGQTELAQAIALKALLQP